MIWWHAVLIAAAGIWAGMINTVVGSGTLVTFPVLVALGYPPLTATTSNAIGLAPGTISGAVGYRHELRGQFRRMLTFVPASLVGAGCGTVLLLSLPPDAFETVVPALVGLAVVLVIIQPRVSTWVLRRRETSGKEQGTGSKVLLITLIFLIGVYGGYFTAAQGVMLMAVMGMLLSEPIQRLNGIKNVLAAVVNVVAGTVYAFIAPVSWPAIALLASGSIVGGWLGARVGRRLSPVALRAVIVVVGVAAMVQMIVRQV
ncbi:putative permease [Saccharomonospora marina XMU15]|uniref:Probable membrane transporter protein n=1 Tax=Saccharomonospora marina XMU15 TaxID=882083 RepID=H5X2B1_9PSEU|nr:sulfite exporter TauE/SafE family protein [Saccharomonospora marina]EHR48707.1 putative permease [Saccharomonospora marina XMU15]